MLMTGMGAAGVASGCGRCAGVRLCHRGEAAVIEPDGVRAAVAIDGEGRPAAIAFRARRLQRDGRVEAAAAIL